MPKAISNSSPLIHLAGIGRLDLLREWYQQVLIPPAVWREVVEEGQGRPGAREVDEAAKQAWVRVVATKDDALVRLLRRDLDDGEAEAIALALEQVCDVILLDESEARMVAGTFSLQKTGTVGLLIRAKQEGKIASLKVELDRLRDNVGFWLHDDLYRQVLSAVDEGSLGQ
jgi:uncharacterized protein